MRMRRSGRRCGWWRSLARLLLIAQLLSNTTAQLRDIPGMKRNALAALLAGTAALIMVLALAMGPWAVVALPSLIAGAVYRRLA